MVFLNQLIANSFQQIVNESRHLLLFQKKQTLGSREVESAVKLVLKGELKKHALTQAA